MLRCAVAPARQSTLAARQTASDRLRDLSQRARQELSGVRGRLGDRDQLRRRAAEAGGWARERLSNRVRRPTTRSAGGIGAGLLGALYLVRRRLRRR